MHAQEAAGVLRHHFGVDPADVRRVARSSFDTWYRVEHPGGTLAFRVGTGPRLHGPGSETAEAAWLAAPDAPIATAFGPYAAEPRRRPGDGS